MVWKERIAGGLLTIGIIGGTYALWPESKSETAGLPEYSDSVFDIEHGRLGSKQDYITGAPAGGFTEAVLRNPSTGYRIKFRYNQEKWDEFLDNLAKAGPYTRRELAEEGKLDALWKAYVSDPKKKVLMFVDESDKDSKEIGIDQGDLFLWSVEASYGRGAGSGGTAEKLDD